MSASRAKANQFPTPILACAICMLSMTVRTQTAQASPSPSAGSDVSAPIQRSELTEKQGARPQPVDGSLPWVDDLYGDEAQIELSASSWLPTSLSLPSQLKNTTEFRDTVVPVASLNILTAPLFRYHRLTASILTGASFGILSRDGTYSGEVTTASTTLQENLYVLSLRLGAETRVELPGPWSVFGDVALLPTAGFTTQTPFDDGQSAYGMPLEFSVGAANDLRWISSSLRGISIKASLDATASVFTSRDFSGVGAQAAVSFPF